MTDFKYKFSQILTLITQAKKEGLVSDDERKTIKECIITKEPDLTCELNEYENDQDLRKLVETLKVMAGITKMFSPADSGLMNIKKKKQGKRAQKKEAPHEDITIQECDLGNSPTIDFKKLKK